MGGYSLIELIVVLSVITLPALALTIRLSLKPVVEAILRLQEGLAESAAVSSGADEIPYLREQVAMLEARVEELAHSEAFYRELRRGEAPPQLVEEG